jgi:hypothetical protein
MSDLGAEILKKWGIRAVIIAVISSLALWAVAHRTAAPGAEVSILWGLVEDTKAVEDAE